MAKKQVAVVPQLSLGDLGGVVLSPEVLEEQRGAWCSPEQYTAAASSEHAFDADPFTNPRSTLKARWLCMLERGDDGFGLAYRDVPGTIYVNPANCPHERLHEAVRRSHPDCVIECNACGYVVLTENDRVWIQPPYDIVPEALAHHGHTRFVCLLRLDTSTGWFTTLWQLCEVIMVPKEDRLAFVPPPGVKASSNPYPHGLFYKRAEDVPQAIRELCYPWPTPQYPWSADPLEILAREHAAAAYQPHEFLGVGCDCTTCGEGICHYLHHLDGCTAHEGGGCDWCR